MNKRLVITVSIFFLILIFTAMIAWIIYYYSTNYGKVIINSDPKDAKIELVVSRNSGETIKLKPKTYELRVKKEGLADFNSEVKIEKGKTKTLNIKLLTEKEQDFISQLPYSNSDFSVEAANDGFNHITYNVTLYPIINGAGDVSRYHQQVKEFKNEATNWITSMGLDPQNININWTPNE